MPYVICSNANRNNQGHFYMSLTNRAINIDLACLKELLESNGLRQEPRLCGVLEQNLTRRRDCGKF
jgi:hypothetical protein